MKGSEANAYKARWALVNAEEVEELRRTSLEQKIGQLASLMASVKQLGWDTALAAEESEVRARWMRLREAYHR